MTAKIIDCKSIIERLDDKLAKEISEYKWKKPRLSVILTSNDPASEIYVKRKISACAKVGIASELTTANQLNDEYHLLDKIYDLNEDKTCDGILIQLPLDVKYKSRQDEILNSISPFKDVDVFHPYNIGLLVQGKPRFVPCTPQGIQLILKEAEIPTKGKHVVVINRSMVVGRPLSSLLLQDNDFANATVTVCHDNTPPEVLKDICLRADIVVVAVGIPGFLKGDMIKEGSVVIDVGITRDGKKILGDVHISAHDKAGYITPVPGGVGLFTVHCLLRNTFLATELCLSNR